MQLESRPVLFFGLWMLTFLGMPIGGGIARLVVGPADTAIRALLAGLLAGAVIGFVQWLMLRQLWPVSPLWIAATAAGLGIGSALSVVVVGNGLSTGAVVLRGLITGVVIAALQWLLLRDIAPNAWLWAFAVAAGWPLAWFVTKTVGVDLAQYWVVFGSSGAIVFSALTGTCLLVMRMSQPAIGFSR